MLQGNITLPFLFDPNFTQYIDVDYSAGQIVIRSVDDSYEPKKIPNQLLGLKVNVELDNKERSGKQSMSILNEAGVAQVAKRMLFIGDSLIRFINKEGIDLHYDINLEKVVCFTKWDNLLLET